MGVWGKRDDFVVHQQEPLNGEPAPGALDGRAITPLDTFYCRNHGPVPQIDPRRWRLRVDGLVERALSLSLDELRERFTERTVVATLQCAGNRRGEMAAVRAMPGQLPWGPAAISTARWTGVALADVLAHAGLRDGAGHVAFEEVDGAGGFGGSVPRDKAERGEVLLAWGMNDVALPAVHGAPVRVVVPGYIGARSVKWLQRVTAQSQPSDNHYQARDYRLLPEDADPSDGGLPLGVAALNAAILCPAPGQVVRAGAVRVSGYATAGDGRGVARVDVSVDGGRCWRQADLEAAPGPWAWRLWRATVQLPPGAAQIVARAWDTSGATQPERVEHVWNPLGYVNTAWSRVDVTSAA